MSEPKITYCAVCGDALTGAEVHLMQRDCHAYHHVCKKHYEYRLMPTIEIVKKQLGFITEYPDWMKQCIVCDCKLTDDEINTITADDYLITCSKHKEVKNWFDKEAAKAWFIYKQNINAKADAKNPKDTFAFNQWRYETKNGTI